MANYSVDVDVLIDVFQSGARGREIGFESVYTSIPHPGSNKTIQGWQWDKRLWPDQKELEALEYAPSIWDPTTSFLTSGYWQSGIGDNKDLLLLSMVDEEIGDQEAWVPKINHGYFYNRQYEWYLFSDDYLVQDFYNDRLHSGFQYTDLTHNPKPGIPIKVRRYRRDRVNEEYIVDKEFRKRVRFTGNTVSGEEADTENDEGYISFENVEGLEPEFIVDYDYGTRPRAWLNGDYSEAIASSGEFSQYELLGVGDDYRNQFYTKYSPIDPSGNFELILYVGSGIYTTWERVDSVADFSESDSNEYKLDPTLGIVTLYSGYPPSVGEKIAARYTKGVSIEYEPEKSRDYILANDADINPVNSALSKGFLTVGLQDETPVSITLESDLATGSNHQASLAGRSSRLTATVRARSGEVLPNQEVQFELISPYISSLIPDSALTDHNGEADIVFLPPQDVDDMGFYTTDFTHSGGYTVINVDGLPEPTNESGVLLYEVHRKDTILGFPASGEDIELNNFLNGEAIRVDPDGTPATSTFEQLYRQQFGLTDLNTIDDTDSSTLSTGRKEVVFHNNPNHIHPHSGIQKDPVYSPVFPIRYSNIGTSSAPNMELVYDSVLPDFNDEIKSYFAIAETTDQVRAYTIHPYTGRRIYSNTLSIDVNIEDKSDGIINCIDSEDVPSGLFRETRNINHYSDDWIVETTSGQLFDRYIETRLASGERGYRELSLEEKTIALYHLDGDLSDSGPYSFASSDDIMSFSENAGYSNRAVQIISSGWEDATVDSDLLQYLSHHSGTIEFAYRAPYRGQVVQSGANQYLGSLLSVNSDGEWNGPEAFVYISSGVSYLGLNYYVKDVPIFDSDPVGTSVLMDDVDLFDGSWHQIKSIWEYTPHESILNSGWFDFDCYVDNILRVSRDDILVGEPIVDELDSLVWERTSLSQVSYQTGGFQDITYGDSLFVAVGSQGEIQTSSDGNNWTSRVPTDRYTGIFYSVTHGGNLFVATGEDAKIATSTDGTTWTTRFVTNGYTSDFRGVAYGNNLFVTVGIFAEIQTSPDGITWTARTADDNYNGIFWSVTYGNGLYVAVGSQGEIQTSPDGITWTARTPDASYNGVFTDVTYGDSLFVAVGSSGEIQTSLDGTTWTRKLDDGKTYRTVTYGNSLYVAMGSGTIIYIRTSSDGTTWTARSAPIASPSYNGVVFGDTSFVAVGSDDLTGIIHTSSDGVDWLVKSPGTTNSKSLLLDIAHGDNLFVSVGENGEIHTSTNGVGWIPRTPAGGYSGDFYSITYGNSLFVTAGNSGEIQTSLDGITWTARTADDGYSGTFSDIVYDNSLFVAVGNQEIQTSLDGATWTARTLGGSAIFTGVTYGNGLYVAVGNDAKIQTSPDGETWTVRTADDYVSNEFFDNAFQDVVYGNSLYVAVGDHAEIQTSPDGETWTTRLIEGEFVGTFRGIIYVNDIFITVGDAGEIQASSDGITWTKISAVDQYTSDLYQIIYDNDLYIMVGDYGEIQVSKQIFRNIVGKKGQTTVIGHYDEVRITSGENIIDHTFQPWYTLDYEGYADWFRRTRPLDSKNLGLDTYLFSGDCPSTIPVGFRLKSSDTDIASRIGHRTFLDINDPLPTDYYTASGLDIYEEYY